MLGLLVGCGSPEASAIPSIPYRISHPGITLEGHDPGKSMTIHLRGNYVVSWTVFGHSSTISQGLSGYLAQVDGTMSHIILNNALTNAGPVRATMVTGEIKISNLDDADYFVFVSSSEPQLLKDGEYITRPSWSYTFFPQP